MLLAFSFTGPVGAETVSLPVTGLNSVFCGRFDGKSVVELSVVDADKGEALRRLARECDADVAVAIGDDETDEWMFAVLSEGSVSVKVGPGETGARFRVPGVADVVALVRTLTRERAAHLATDDDPTR